MTNLEIEWSETRWYRATIDLDNFADLSIEDFPAGTQDLSERVQEVLSDLEAGYALWQIDGVEISRATPQAR